jgi:uncharacterized membrane protein
MEMTELDRRLERWRQAGIITATQVDQIRALEASSRAEQRIPLVAEVVGYLGTALVVSAVVALAAQFWEDLATGAKIAVLIVITAMLLVAGWAVRDSEEPAIRRLSNFLWLAAVGTTGFLMDEIMTDALDVETGYPLIIGSAMSALGLALWRVRKSAVQLIGLFAGLIVVMAGIADIWSGADRFGILAWLLGVVWLVLARLNIVTPERTSYALAGGSMLFGTQWAAFEHFEDGHGWALGLGLVSAVTLLMLSVSWRSTVLLGIGTTGAFLFLPQITDEYLGDTIGGPSALLVAGVALIGVAVMAVRLRDKVGR